MPTRAVHMRQPSAAPPRPVDRTRAPSPGAPLRTGVAQGGCPCGGGCPRCASPGFAVSVLRVRDGRGLQAKLVMGDQDSNAEHEADRTAGQALSSAHGQPSIPRDTGGAPGAAAQAPESVERALAHSGTALDAPVRRDMQEHFGYDLSRVRVHRDAPSEQSAREIGARAYTVGRDIVFGAGQYAPASSDGRRLLAHELAHVLQQTGPDGSAVVQPTLRRTPAPPQSGGHDVPFDRSKVNVSIIPDIDASPGTDGKPAAIAQTVTVTFGDPAIVRLEWQFYDPADAVLPGGFATVETAPNAVTAPFNIQNKPPTTWTPVAGRHLVRCIGYDTAGTAIAYADRSFYLWTVKPSGKPPDIAALAAEKTQLEATIKKGSGKSFGEVGAATARLKKLEHDLAILETGTGTRVGNKCPVAPAGTTPTDCTSFVLELLSATFAQQGRAADWAKVQKKYAENTAARGGLGLSGLDVQAALQSEAGWQGIYWAPDPSYQIPKAELDKANSSEASYTSAIAKKQKTYYKDFGKAGYPGVSIAQRVINYAPEKPTAPAAPASTTTVDTSQLEKLKKVPFGVLAAHGGEHMTIISYGKVVEVHWRKAATDPNLIEETSLEKWAVGPNSGYHYYASGTIVAPAADIVAAFK